ncbi:UNVERIFIED_CONTAM: hypothetical protein Scaly_3041600 [Sesamum calycinum]|uniref:Endonuclease/exonuclease/phosphatase domain-containing protein n=1 Tax=Sesamum calycinum TaxID=2727403 RepID=A0AAW2K7E6_9LAMI
MDLSIFIVVHSTNVCIQGILDDPWLILGDFNAVMDDSEVCGRAADTSASMADFRNCIRDTGLVQLPFTGCPYTWHNCSEGHEAYGRGIRNDCEAEVNMLQQRAKLRWLKHGDQSSKFFFRKINSTRMKQRIFQITKASGEILTAQHDVNQEFTLYFQNLLGGSSNHRILDLRFLRHELKHTITTTEASLLVAL